MKYTTKAAEKSTMKITMKFDADEWKDALNKAYVKTKGRYSVNGFRKGKAPRNVIEHAYGKGVFFEDALNVLFSENYGTVLDKEEKKFTAVGDPELSVDDLSDDGVTLVAVTPVRPEVKIGSYKGMKIKEFAYNVEDADVDKEIERLLDRNARKIEVSDRPCQNGDTVNIDFVGTIDGVKFDGGEAAGFDLTLGSGQFIPGFEDQVVGMNVGESRDVNVRFPENYQAEELKGKDAVFAVKLNSVKGKELPELTDAFIKDATGSETIEEYKAKTKERLQQQADKNSLDATENSILDAISATAEAEIPQAMIEREIDGLVQKFEYQLMYQGLKLQDYLDFIKTTKEEFRKNYEEQAKKNVLNQLVISQIIKDEKIEATDEEVEAKVAEQAASVDKSAEEYKKGMDPRQYDYIKSDIIITKLFDFLKANNEMYVEESK
ncbi:MAG: trigger factor [Christensenellaceae bacterium]|jgi:trigger factor|nr:trigger factor [Clostridia bacterium]PWL97339.1 MAG: trigger factor [Clostridiales bacterium]